MVVLTGVHANPWPSRRNLSAGSPWICPDGTARETSAENRHGEDDSSKANRYRLEMVPEGIDPKVNKGEVREDDWRFLAMIPVHQANGSAVMANLLERTVEAPIQAFGHV